MALKLTLSPNFIRYNYEYSLLDRVKADSQIFTANGTFIVPFGWKKVKICIVVGEAHTENNYGKGSGAGGRGEVRISWED